jgi:IclR family transcriptional regulator, acetate operon repressor
MATVEDNKAPTSVLERVVSLLDCFTADDSDLTLAALASRTGIPKPTVHRLAGVLVERRLLTRTPTGFTLGIRLFELGELVGDRRALRDASLPYLQELFEQTRETIHLGVLDGDEVLYFAKIVGYKAFPLPTRTGGRWPVHASALGKVLLAFGSPDRYQDLVASDLKALTPYTITDPSRLSLQLRRARREGVAYEIQESVLGNACVAGPIFDSAGHPVAAVSISGPSVRLRPEQRAPLVRRAAAKITSCISGRVPEGWSSRLPAAAQRQGRELPDRGRTILIRGLSGSEPTQIPG